jgi:hypothetical protein
MCQNVANAPAYYKMLQICGSKSVAALTTLTASKICWFDKLSVGFIEAGT